MSDFPDSEKILILGLEEEFNELAQEVADGTLHVDTETPADLENVLPFVRVGRVAGTDDRFTDRAIMDVEVFAGTRQAAYDLSEAIRTWLLAAPHRVGGVGIIDKAFTEVGPRSLPWDNENVRRRGATYRISTRRR